MDETVLCFWFEEIEPKQWWTAESDFDEQVRARFQRLHEQAARGELYAWRAKPSGRLAEIIVLDQFSRNIYRNTSAAFAQDPMALVLAQEAVAAGVPESLSQVECSFLLMPFMHSESRRIHEIAEQLYRAFAPASSYEFELRHKVIIERFGRYPHRNEILGRHSTPEEAEFLKHPGSGF